MMKVLKFRKVLKSNFAGIIAWEIELRMQIEFHSRFNYAYRAGIQLWGTTSMIISCEIAVSRKYIKHKLEW